MGVFDKIKELAGDNAELMEEIKSAESKYSELYSSNEDLTGQLEKAIRDRDEHIKRRENSIKEMRELQEKLQNAPKGSEEHQQQLDQLRKEYEDKENSYRLEIESTKNKLYETRKEMKFAELNLGALLPQGKDPEYIDTKVNFFKFDLSRSGVDYDPEIDDLVVKKDGVPLINPQTAKPYTAKEIVSMKVQKAWADDVNTTPNPKGAGRGNVDTAGGQPQRATVDRASFEGMSQAERHSFIKEGGKVIE